MEIWKDIKGYEGFYKVSNIGRVKRLETITKCFDNGNKVGYRIVKERILKAHLRINNGYASVPLSKNYKVKRFLIHRLVADSFIDNQKNYPLVMHKDNNRQNNNVSNLQWGTHRMNHTQKINDGRAANQYGKYTWKTNK